MKPYKPPISTEKTPDDACRLAVRASLSPRRGKSIGQIAKLCDLGMNTVRRHLKNLLSIGYARKIGRGSGTKYLSSRPGSRAAAIQRELARINLTPEQIDKGIADIRAGLEEQRQRYLKRRKKMLLDLRRYWRV